jgi:hypothetical protein
MSRKYAIGIVSAAINFLLACALAGVVLNPSASFIWKPPRPAPRRLHVVLKINDPNDPDTVHVFEVPAYAGTITAMQYPYIEVQVSELDDE